MQVDPLIAAILTRFARTQGTVCACCTDYGQPAADAVYDPPDPCP